MSVACLLTITWSSPSSASSNAKSLGLLLRLLARLLLALLPELLLLITTLLSLRKKCFLIGSKSENAEPREKRLSKSAVDANSLFVRDRRTDVDEEEVEGPGMVENWMEEGAWEQALREEEGKEEVKVLLDERVSRACAKCASSGPPIAPLISNTGDFGMSIGDFR